ncbi:Major facilitator superfamily domain general substrate transporter [Penicillium waksmanii]|uniref:Major facilitator superfamily domain general substrate transporter n=1 Tax=Penicillium waksmanii TaxID=69791 RepID=UPI002548150A|nr:Major facilitator superfamily domain general substrate transporter [Penicillium waksmanii]KAJ5965235.1 Major facilitator superfamily domain general substrate transporter [Penicillium waksmanii]
MAKDDISSAGNAFGDVERQDSVPAAKETDNAKAATETEHKMTLLQGIRTYPKAIGWSVLISTCIAMEGDVLRDWSKDTISLWPLRTMHYTIFDWFPWPSS